LRTDAQTDQTRGRRNGPTPGRPAAVVQGGGLIEASTAHQGEGTAQPGEEVPPAVGAEVPGAGCEQVIGVTTVVAEQQTEADRGAVRGGVTDPLEQIDRLPAEPLRVVELGPGEGQGRARQQHVPAWVRAGQLVGTPLQPCRLGSDRGEPTGVPVGVDQPQSSPHLDLRAARLGSGGDHPRCEMLQLGDVVRAAAGELARPECRDGQVRVTGHLGPPQRLGADAVGFVVQAAVHRGLRQPREQPHARCVVVRR
jgi:hypothetical protein